MQMHTDPYESGTDLSDCQQLRENADNHKNHDQSGISILGKTAYNRIPVISLAGAKEESDEYGKDCRQNQRLHRLIMDTDHDDTAQYDIRYDGYDGEFLMHMEF